MPEWRGSCAAPLRRIGQVELLEPETFTKRDFGVAAWWEKVSCQPQTVELKSNGYWVCWSFAGNVIDAHFPALFGGVPVTYDKTGELGKWAYVSFQWYDYGFAQQRMLGKLPANMLFHLDPPFGCGVRVVDSFTRPGEKHCLYFLTINESEVCHA